MNINEASGFFKSLITETDKKSEIRVYEKFIGILSDLKNRKLTEKQLKSIEEELDTLKIKANPENRKKYFNQKLTEFKKYLKAQFSFISEGYYTGIGMSLGMSFGVAFGAAFRNDLGITYGLISGMLVGLIIGAVMDSKAKKEGRVLKLKHNN